MSDTAEAVRRVIAEETGFLVRELRPEADLRARLRLNDRELCRLLIALESEFDIVFDADDARELTTVGRLVRLVERQTERFTRRRRAAR